MCSFSGVYGLWGLFIMNLLDRYRYRCRHLKLVPFHLLSQLDLNRFWDRVLRRAELPIAFSQGFNPRPLLSFGPATVTGVISWTECLDMTFYESIEPEQIKNLLNSKVPEAMRIVEINSVPLDFPSIMKSINSVQYVFIFKDDGKITNHHEFFSIEDIEELERKKMENQECMVSFLFKKKNILMNPYKSLEFISKESGFNRENLLEVIKQNYRWSYSVEG